MIHLLVSFSIALTFTMAFSLRYNKWSQPTLILKYFLFIWMVEGVTHYFFIPPDTFGMEVAYVCLFISFALFLGGRVIGSRLLKY